ncbi:uroporphyrinogen-III C-methyltransferase [Clostridium sp.]|uniref:uroporphyrinogen-III C-methyltransferase n=1 Tax=Clostridium sp. TaxID=1506 RepID=UPI003D6CAA31
MGKVYLIGAGPGDPELMTLKAVRVLKKCTAVMYDRLAGANALKHLDEGCKVFYCGKEPGCHYKSQDEINEMLVTLAKEGYIVGRVKGGDPYVFGRGGEEALRLCKEGIDFEVIPGVTSAISVLSYAGIPVTHRGLSQGFHVFTGMSAEKLNINWEGVSSLNGTLIFLMGLNHLYGITRNLINSGKSIETPCAVVMRGTTAKQKKVVGTLEDIASKVKEALFTSPCIIVVGEVVTLGENLNWYEKMPLFGLNICTTRSVEQSKSINERLVDLGAEVTEINSIKIKSSDTQLDSVKNKLGEYEHIIFTSVNAVNIFFDYMKGNNLDIRSLKGEIAVIGSATERCLKNRGINPDTIAEEFVAEDLFDKLCAKVKPKDKILIPCSKHSRAYLSDKLREYGAIVDKVHIYEPICGQLTDVNAFGNVDIVIFTSPSTVKNMIKFVGLDAIVQKKSVAIGPITAKELELNGINPFVCKEYSEDGIISKILELN